MIFYDVAMTPSWFILASKGIFTVDNYPLNCMKMANIKNGQLKHGQQEKRCRNFDLNVTA
jgi:hypothetical protein